MNLVGKLQSKEELKSGVSGTGNAWSMIKFTVLQKGFQKPTELDLTAFGSEVSSFINDTSVGTQLALEIIVETKSKEWNGKSWRGTEVKCIRAETVREKDVVTETDHKGVQQMAQMHNQQYQRAKDTSFAPQEDDLPF